MELTLTTPALLFPALSLLLLAYTNRFLALANLIRELHRRYHTEPAPGVAGQLANLRRRVYIIRDMQALGIASLFACVLCMFLLFAGQVFAGRAGVRRGAGVAAALAGAVVLGNYDLRECAQAPFAGYGAIRREETKVNTDSAHHKPLGHWRSGFWLSLFAGPGPARPIPTALAARHSPAGRPRFRRHPDYRGHADHCFGAPRICPFPPAHGPRSADKPGDHDRRVRHIAKPPLSWRGAPVWRCRADDELTLDMGTLLVSLIVCHYVLIVPEEKYLAAKFGAEYEAYTATVQRWLGRKRPAKL
jgi:hypothetical protein